MSTYTVAQLERWNPSITQYDEIWRNNVESRLTFMTAIDRDRFAKKHNVASSAVADIRTYMITWGGFQHLISSGFSIHNNSALFIRLLNGIAPLIHEPPKSFGKSWYDLFDYPDRFHACSVAFYGKSRRSRDAHLDVYLLKINEGLWSCSDWSLSANDLIGINNEWCKPVSLKSDLWQKACRVISRRDILFHIRFGQWAIDFQLTLNVSEERLLNAYPLETIDNYSDLFSIIGSIPILQWTIKNTAQNP